MLSPSLYHVCIIEASHFYFPALPFLSILLLKSNLLWAGDLVPTPDAPPPIFYFFFEENRSGLLLSIGTPMLDLGGFQRLPTDGN